MFRLMVNVYLVPPTAGNLNKMRTVHKQHLQIRNRLVNQFGHVMNDSAAVHDFDFKILAAKVHHMIEIHNEFAVFRHVENPLGQLSPQAEALKKCLRSNLISSSVFTPPESWSGEMDPSTGLSMTFSETTSDRSTSLIIETA